MGTNAKGNSLVTVAALLLALGLFTNSWWNLDFMVAEVSVGAFEVEACSPEQGCRTINFTEAMKISNELGWFDAIKIRLTQWGGLGALGLLIVCLIAGSLKSSGLRGIASALYIPTALVAGLSGFLFYRMFAASEVGTLGSMGYSFIVFEVGLVLGMVGILRK